MSLQSEYLHDLARQQSMGLGQRQSMEQQSFALQQLAGGQSSMLAGLASAGLNGMGRPYYASLTLIEEMRIEVDEYLKGWDK